MISSHLANIRQPQSRSRARRARRNHATADPLPNQLLRRPGAHDDTPSTSQTLERPQQTGVLWEPGRLYPPRARRVPGAESQQRLTQPQARPLPPPVPNSSFSSEDADAITDARKARVADYLSSWDRTWIAVSANPNVETATEDIPDIGGMTISDPSASSTGGHASSPGPSPPTEFASPREVPAEIDNKFIFELSPPKSPEGSDGGVVIPQEEQVETHLHLTAAMQLAELKAKIPWMVEQRTIDGAGWRQLGEYYWAGGSKKVGQ